MSKIIFCNKCGNPIDIAKEFSNAYASVGGKATLKKYGRGYFGKLAKKGWAKRVDSLKIKV